MVTQEELVEDWKYQKLTITGCFLKNFLLEEDLHHKAQLDQLGLKEFKDLKV
jgi:hypothetical protein